MSRILIIGNFGEENKLNGQVMRTRTVYESIKKKYEKSYVISKIDTTKKNIFVYVKAAISILFAQRIVILPAQNGLKPLLLMINCLGAAPKTIHVAIGGWLTEHLNNQKWIDYENNLMAVLVQMKSLKANLEAQGVKNVIHFPNYRENTGECIKIKNTQACVPKKFVFYARIIPEKGIFEAIEAIKQLNAEGHDITLDIYGPADEVVLTTLLQKINHTSSIAYHGALKPGEILTTLHKYDMMIFPTYYQGEGFPGTILESFMAGVPVVASDWKYNAEIVEEKETGLLCEPHSVDSIVRCIKSIRNSEVPYENMPHKCFEVAKEYSPEIITKILFTALKLDN